MTYRTLKLDQSTWDLTIDSRGYMAVAGEGEAIAQDVASACALFLGECYYNTALGIPYDTQVLGRKFSQPYLNQQLKNQAKTIKPVERAVVSMQVDRFTRKLRAVVLTQDTSGNTQEVIL